MLRTFAAALVMGVSTVAFARPLQDPHINGSTTRLIPFTASLPNADAAAAGPRSVTFALYDEAEGGTRLWSEVQVVNADARGRYTAYLGAAHALPIEIFRTEQARWLEVSVDGRAMPRTMLVAVPYALRAADAETLSGKPLSDFVLADANGGRVRADGTTIDAAAVDGTGVANQLAKWSDTDTLSSSILTESFDNRLGVLAPDPTGGGVVDSRFTIRNLDNNTAIGILNNMNARRFALNTRSNGSWILYDGFGATWNAGLRQVDGAVGINVDPFARLTVQETEATRPAATFTVVNPSTVAAVRITTDSTNAALAVLNSGGGHGATIGVTGNATSLRVDVPGLSNGNLIVGRQAATPVFRVDADGDVFAPSYTAGGADFAEELEPADPLISSEPGDVLVIGTDRDRTVMRAGTPYSTGVIGIHSTKPGIVASPYAATDPRRDGTLPVAMVGIVPCKITTENGPIARGDLLVTSSTPGHAMKGTDRARMTGAIVGKALEPFAAGSGTILVAVTLQ